MNVTRQYATITDFVMAMALTALLFASVAEAQPRPGARQPMPLAEAHAIWRAQGTSVVSDLEIPAEPGEKVVTAYIAARESHRKALDELRGQGGGQGGFERYREVSEQERGKLEVALKEILGEEKAATALEQLGTFGRQWDRYVRTLLGMKLEEEVMKAAMKEVNVYNVASAKAFRDAAGGDRQSMRSTFTKLKSDLDAALAKLLTADQLAKWNEETTLRPRQ